MENLQAHSDHIGQNDVGSKSVGNAHRQEPWESVVSSIKNDKNDQPNANYAQAEDEKPLKNARQ